MMKKMKKFFKNVQIRIGMDNNILVCYGFDSGIERNWICYRLKKLSDIIKERVRIARSCKS